ncbi:MAG: D-aminoacyl-tRNA deacylase [Defluviitaleaceae bacterium]|nr:D-aminoacyl-tRNA deacylase [Defluviitaleaceae bacterium]
MKVTKTVLQRVTSASVTIGGNCVGSIGKGYLILLGLGAGDSESDAVNMIEKIYKLRIFPDSNGKSNLSIKEVNGEVLIISQFTLYADCKKGNRPSFTGACPPEDAERLYECFIKLAEKTFVKVSYGKFGADMKVALVNDGPYTIVLES